MSQLKNSGELWKSIVPAVFHVDYWDGLGWPDRFAKAEFTLRQRRYAASWPTGAVYTPAFVVNGKEWSGFFDRKAPPKSDVKRGENRGRKLVHDFVVLHLVRIDMVNEGNHWRGTVSLSTKAETDKPTALAAWIKSAETAVPIQATGGWLKP